MREEEKENQIKDYIKKNYTSKKELRKLKTKYEYYLDKAIENQERVMKTCYGEILNDLIILLMN